MSLTIKAGSTDQSVYFHLIKVTDGTNYTGLVYNTASLKAYYVLNRGSATSITLATLASANSAHSDGGFKEVDATNMPGVYRLDLPDAAVASGISVVVTISGATDLKAESKEIFLSAYDPQSATNLGLSKFSDIETDTQDIQTRLPAALVGGRIDANMGAISADATAADNAEAFFDGTGYAGTNNVIPTVTTVTTTTNLTNLPTIPNNWITAAGINSDAFTAAKFAADVTTELQSGLATASALATLQTTANNIEADTQNIQTRLPAALVSGRIDASIGAAAANTITASALATDAVDEIVDGVWDEVLTGATHNVATSAGRRLRTLQDTGNYQFGAVWLDTNGANTGSTFPDDGTYLNPVNTLARALTVAAAATQPIKSIHIVNNSSITLTATMSGYTFDGYEYAIALGGQNVENCSFNNFRSITGTATGNNPIFSDGTFGAVTLPPCVIMRVGLSGTLTVGSAGDFVLIDCVSQTAGSSTPTIDLGSAVGATNMSIRRWSGGVTFDNIKAGDVISLDAISGGTVTVNGTGGTINIRGMVKVVDGSSGAVTIVQTQVVNTETINAQADLALSDVGLTSTVTGRIDAAISSRLATAGYTAPDNASIAAILVDTAEIGAAGAGLTALASAANLATVDTVVDGIKAKTDNLPASPAATGDIPTADITAIKAKTDNLTFTVSGQVDANAESMNGAEILGNGTAGNLWRGS